jgi:hypothetical protein
MISRQTADPIHSVLYYIKGFALIWLSWNRIRKKMNLYSIPAFQKLFEPTRQTQGLMTKRQNWNKNTADSFSKSFFDQKLQFSYVKATGEAFSPPLSSLDPKRLDSQHFFQCTIRTRNSFSDMATSSVKFYKLQTVKWSDPAWDKLYRIGPRPKLRIRIHNTAMCTKTCFSLWTLITVFIK